MVRKLGVFPLRMLSWSNILLDVPLIWIYNNCMMNEKEIKTWVEEASSEFYWNFRDDLDDESAELMKEELDKLEARMFFIVKNSLEACSSPDSEL